MQWTGSVEPTKTYRPPPRRQQSLADTFWRLARGSQYETQSREPVDVALHMLAAIKALQGSTSAEINAAALDFLLRLEHDARYGSPEQIRCGEKDGRALVYTIGVLLFERLTGHHPFVEALSPMQQAVIRDHTAQRGANNLCSIPMGLREVLRRAMSPFPEDRYADVDALREALEAYVARAETMFDSERATTEMSTRVATAPVAGSGARRRTRSTPPPCPGSPERAEMEQRVAIARQMHSEPPSAPRFRASGSQPGVRPPAAARPPIAPVIVPIRAKRPGRKLRLELRALQWTAIVAITAAAVTVAAAVGAGVGSDEARALPPAPEPAPVVIVEQPMEVAAPAPEPPAPPPVFDAEAVGAAALTALPACFTDDRLDAGVRFGVSLRFAPEDGRVERVYFAPEHGLSHDERVCATTALEALTPAAPPEARTTATYDLRIATEAPLVRTRLN